MNRLFFFIAFSMILLPSFAYGESYYMSLKTSEANLRVGPGTHYPIEWIYKQKGLPLAVVSEFGHWRKVRDWEGSIGWIHKSLLSVRKQVMIIDKVQNMHKEPVTDSHTITRLQPGVIAQLFSCKVEFCMIKINGYKGWVNKRFLWGTP